MSARQSAILCCVLLSLTAAGCFKPHRAPVAQGNVINRDDAEKLETGMTRAQVEYLLGRPILQEPFETARWNYVFYFRLGHEEPRTSRVSLYFEDNVLNRIEGDLQATEDEVVNQLEQTEPEPEEDEEDDTARPRVDPDDPTAPPDPTGTDTDRL